MGVVANKHHVDSWINYGVIVSLLQARFYCPKPTRCTIFQVSLLLPLIHVQQQSLRNWSLLQNRDQHYFRPLACKSKVQASSDQETRRLSRYAHTAFTNELVSFSHIECTRGSAGLLKLEVGGKIVVIHENLNSQILLNRPFVKIFHCEYFLAYSNYYTCTCTCVYNSDTIITQWCTNYCN